MSTEVNFPDDARFAIEDVRSDSSDTKWALFSHRGNPNEIFFVEKGTGEPEEIQQYLEEGEVMYALVRVEETIDLSETVKFVLVYYSGPNVSFVAKAKYGVITGSIKGNFAPYHNDMEIDSADELTNDAVMEVVKTTSGQKSKVLEASEAKTRPERGFTSGHTTKADPSGYTPTKSTGPGSGNVGKHGSTFAGMKPKGSSKEAGLTFADDIKEAISNIRNGCTDTWCVCGYEDEIPKKGVVVLLGVGDDSTQDGMRAEFKDDNIRYGFVKVTDKVDDIATVKFVCIQWIGEGVKPMAKAKASTHKGEIEKVFDSHTTIFATQASEVNQRAVMDKVMSASGSKSHVR